MSKSAPTSAPPDQDKRQHALDTARSILVQAPAGSGKTDLLTRRFLRLLGEVDNPAEIVAITFTIPAAAEMRHRILSELEKAAGEEARFDLAHNAETCDPSMPALAWRAMQRSQQRGWDLLRSPAQLRISTIDSFCRELALQKPLLSDLGGEVAIHPQPTDLYRRAARKTLEEIDGTDSVLSAAIATLLDWRDNNWQEMEDLLVEMLAARDRWMHEFVLQRELDWDALRERLERPFAKAMRDGLTETNKKLGQAHGAREEALELARFACEQTGGQLHRDLAELADFPCEPFDRSDLEGAHRAYVCLANLVLTGGDSFRKQVDKRLGFPTDRKLEKSRILTLIGAIAAVPGLEAALAAIRDLPPARYTEDDWQVVRACFAVLRHAAGQLRVVFAETGAVDFTEVSQNAQAVLTGDDGFPSDAAQSIADGIRHLLVDEFQDTSRRQHALLRGLVSAWPDREGRTLFAVGDPMQSIYFFRDADAELFPRVRKLGLEIPDAESLSLDFVPLSANFRTTPSLVKQLNERFEAIFAVSDGSGIPFAPAVAQRNESASLAPRFALHLEFIPRNGPSSHAGPDAASKVETAREAQTAEIVELIRRHLTCIEEKHARGEKLRIAVLGRTKSSLQLVAAALREASIPFRAIDLESLGDRPEVLDAIALAHALLNPQDRVAWLGVLRAPWCGLALDDLHALVSNDEEPLLERPVPELLAERIAELSSGGQISAKRILDATNAARNLRNATPNASLGTWLEQVWLRLGGADCVDATGRANINLLWSCLDNLPNGEQDVLSSALKSALEKLTALPDPAASGDHGVQLMTIHKAKGLEFEVVIVPDLQARGGQSGKTLLSWLERGVAPDADNHDPHEITEFLIAPLQSKGTERSAAKSWVDRVRRDREEQEDRRILYVAATRAREELHLFARPAYKAEDDGTFTLCEPRNSLLATAWPALSEDVLARFKEWKNARHEKESAEVGTIAAASDDNLFTMPSPVKSTVMRRLPIDYRPMRQAPAISSLAHPAIGAMEEFDLYERHEGGIASRALGRAVHSFMEQLAHSLATKTLEAARSALKQFVPQAAGDLRAIGFDRKQSTDLAAEALKISLQASGDSLCQWILSPHADSASEVRWTGVIQGNLRTVQIDRVYRAGEVPIAEGETCWWIVDFKTYEASPGSDPSILLPQLRELFAQQLAIYAAVLRNLHGSGAPIRAGLYYPRMLLFDWWEL